MASEEKELEERMPAIAAEDAATFEQALQTWEQEMERVFEDNRAAEQLSAEDLAIRINTKA